MAENIISSILASPSLVILNQTEGIVAAKNLKVVKGIIRLVSESFGHSMEAGNTQIDTRVMKPFKVAFDVICPDIQTLDQVNNVLLDRKSLYQVKTRGIIVANLQVDNETLRQSADMTIATPVRISFQQIMIQHTSPVVFDNPASASIIDRGIAAVDSIQSSAADLYGKVSGKITTLLS